MKTILPVSVVLFLMGSTVVAQAEMKLPELKKQPTVQAVLDEHLDALNKCDWNRLVAQYPEDAQINLPGGTIAKGRAAIGELFAGFCKDAKDGGLKGIHFDAVISPTIGNTIETQGFAPRPFFWGLTRAMH